MLNTPEAIAAWRQERKRRWPSDKVVQEKLEKQKTSSSSSSSSSSSTIDHRAGRSKAGGSASNENRPCRFLLHSGKCRAGDSCTFSHEVTHVVDCDHWTNKGHCKWKNKCFKRHDKTKKGSNKGKGGNNKTRGPKPPPNHKPTLLKKLMVDDEYVERATLLECMAYMVDQNFFVEKEEVVEMEIDVEEEPEVVEEPVVDKEPVVEEEPVVEDKKTTTPQIQDSSSETDSSNATSSTDKVTNAVASSNHSGEDEVVLKSSIIEEVERVDWSTLKVVDLRAELKARSLDTKGRKAALIARLESDWSEKNK